MVQNAHEPPQSRVTRLRPATVRSTRLFIVVLLAFLLALPASMQAASPAQASPTLTLQLAGEPLIVQPRAASVPTDTDQTYQLNFSQPMNRTSVQQQLTARAKQYQAEDPSNRILPAFRYQWSSDRQLQVTAVLPAAVKANPKAAQFRQYVIQVDGARTASGQKLSSDVPMFTTSLAVPYRLYQISLQDGKLQLLKKFARPYDGMQFSDPESRYLLMDRPVMSCGCAFNFGAMQSVYDLATGKLLDFPLPITSNYTGVGSFYADPRGFFYAATQASAKVPKTTAIKPMKIVTKQRVYGTTFSENHQAVIALLGPEKPNGVFDLLVQPFDGSTPSRYLSAIHGYPEDSMLDIGDLPISLTAQGGKIEAFVQTAKQDRYEWKQYDTQIQEERTLAIPDLVRDAPEYQASDDGLYRLYFDGVYDVRSSSLTPLDRPSNAYWLPNTRRLAYLTSEGADPAEAQLRLYDADTKSSTQILSGLPDDTLLLGVDSASRFAYVMSTH